MWTRHTSCDLPKKRLLDSSELRRLDDVQDLLNLAQEHNFLLTASLGPVLEQTPDHRLRQCRIFFQKLDYAVGKLCMVK